MTTATAPKTPLTRRQQDVIDFIKSSSAAEGFPPTIREIGKAIGVSSPNGVMCHLRALERKGAIKRSSNSSRAIKVLI